MLDWPLRETCLAYFELLKARAQHLYEYELLRWTIWAPHEGKKKRKPPEMPKILRNPHG